MEDMAKKSGLKLRYFPEGKNWKKDKWYIHIILAKLLKMASYKLKWAIIEKPISSGGGSRMWGTDHAEPGKIQFR